MRLDNSRDNTKCKRIIVDIIDCQVKVLDIRGVWWVLGRSRSKKALTGAGVIGMVRGGSGGGSMVDPGWIHIEKGGSGFYECYK